MLHSEKYYRTLELDKVLQRLADQCSCEDSRKLALNLRPVTDFYQAQALMKKTSDAHALSARYAAPTIHRLKNVCDALVRAEKGSNLSLGELMAVASVLANIRSVKDWRNRCDVSRTSLDELFEYLYPNKGLENAIRNAIVSEEEVSDTASKELGDIRRKINAAQLRIRDKLDKMIHSPSQNKFLQETIITQRDGRFVVPVKAEYRSEVKGLVHDTSASGATIFVEPMAVVEANNEIKVLQAKEKREIERIIAELSAEVGVYSQSIISSYELLVEIDLYFAKATLAYKMKASVPNLVENGEIDLKKARHPLIDPAVVVPTDVTLGKTFDTLVITGPNTGGKTVTLKTIGLLTLMAMCGLMIPANENSTISVFKKVLVDIGDEQSIEQSLSTFSAHMTNTVSIIEEADDESLVLLDELGSGTDPIEGAALAISILERLRAYGAKIAATTHYAEMKVFALQTPGVQNASCEFDVETLKPTYRLLIGIPGKSNAFAISQRLGLDESIIEAARQNISTDNSRFEDVIAQLDAARQELEKEKETVSELRRQQEKDKQDWEEYKIRVNRDMEKELQAAQDKANRIVSSVRAESEKLLEELDDIRRQKESEEFSKLVQGATAGYRSAMNKITDTANPVIRTLQEEYVLPRPLKKGDTVLIVKLQQEGTVLSEVDSSNRVMVQAGIMKTKVAVDELRLIEKKGGVTLNGKPHKQHKQQTGSVSKSITSRSERSASSEVDLRGMNVEEGLMTMDQYIDNCVLSGVKNVTIIHGKGTGVLRTAVHSHLKKHKMVRTFRLGVYGEGESGVTIVELK